MRTFFLNSIFYRSCREESRIYYGVGTLFLHLSAKIAKLNEHRFVLKISWFNSQCSCNFISWNSNFKLKARISSASQVKLNIHRSINLSLWTYINLLTQQLFPIKLRILHENSLAKFERLMHPYIYQTYYPHFQYTDARQWFWLWI